MPLSAFCCKSFPMGMMLLLFLLQYTGMISDMRWHCRNGTYMVPTGAGGLVDILMMDTNPFLRRYQKTSWYNNAGKVPSSA